MIEAKDNSVVQNYIAVRIDEPLWKTGVSIVLERNFNMFFYMPWIVSDPITENGRSFRTEREMPKNAQDIYTWAGIEFEKGSETAARIAVFKAGFEARKKLAPDPPVLADDARVILFRMDRELELLLRNVLANPIHNSCHDFINQFMKQDYRMFEPSIVDLDKFTLNNLCPADCLTILDYEDKPVHSWVYLGQDFFVSKIGVNPTIDIHHIHQMMLYIRSHGRIGKIKIFSPTTKTKCGFCATKVIKWSKVSPDFHGKCEKCWQAWYCSDKCRASHTTHHCKPVIEGKTKPVVLSMTEIEVLRQKYSRK